MLSPRATFLLSAFLASMTYSRKRSSAWTFTSMQAPHFRSRAGVEFQPSLSSEPFRKRANRLLYQDLHRPDARGVHHDLRVVVHLQGQKNEPLGKPGLFLSLGLPMAQSEAQEPQEPPEKS